ncbi:MAG: hypothetical protein AAFP76_09830 [Bacteroidota bacterium]
MLNEKLTTLLIISNLSCVYGTRMDVELLFALQHILVEIEILNESQAA